MGVSVTSLGALHSAHTKYTPVYTHMVPLPHVMPVSINL